MKIYTLFVFIFNLVSAKCITFGDDASVTSWRFQASLQYQNRHICGAIVVSTQWVITAAHCISSPLGYTVVAGLYDLTEQQAQTERVYVNYIIKHPQYEGGCSGTSCYPNDIALLNVQDIPINSYIQMARLDSGMSGRENQECYITGWGKGSSTGDLMNILQEGRVWVLSGDECRLYWGSYIDDTQHACALDRDEYVTYCDGDTGGALSCRASATDPWDVVGVISWGMDGCNAASAMVNTRMESYCSWINSETGGDVNCA